MFGSNPSTVPVLVRKMNKLAALVFTLTLAVASPSMAASYSTEATLTLNKGKARYEVAGRVCRLVEREGALTEEVIARPKVISTPGASGSFYAGADRSEKEFANQENVSMDVFWPEEKDSFVICTITVRRGDAILSRTSMKFRATPE